MIDLQIQTINKNSKSGLQLNPIKVDSAYCSKWNVDNEDFVLMVKNGEPLTKNLYRVGGIGQPNLNSYFLILKYVEAHYSDSITKVKKDKPHLEGRWCIYDKYGVEKKEFKSYSSPYLVKDSCIYSINREYYNIESGELYCHVSTAQESTDFLFLENRWDNDSAKRGVLKINKSDGSFELFK